MISCFEMLKEDNFSYICISKMLEKVNGKTITNLVAPPYSFFLPFISSGHLNLYISLSIFLSCVLSFSLFLYIFLSICLSVYLSFYIYVLLYFCLCIFLPFLLPTLYVSVCLSVFPSFRPVIGNGVEDNTV